MIVRYIRKRIRKRTGSAYRKPDTVISIYTQKDVLLNPPDATLLKRVDKILLGEYTLHRRRSSIVIHGELDKVCVPLTEFFIKKLKL